MYFLEDIKPLVIGCSLRFLLAWIELVVLALTLPGSYSLPSTYIIFAATALAFLGDSYIGFRRRKSRRTAYARTLPYIYQPKVLIACFDFIFAIGFSGLWVMSMLATILPDSSQSYDYSNVPVLLVYYSEDNKKKMMATFETYQMVGWLVIAHVRWFLGAYEIRLLKQRSGKAPAAVVYHGHHARKDGVIMSSV